MLHDVDAACTAAAHAVDSWRWTTFAERQRALLALADVLEDKAEELVAVGCADTGKPYAATMSEDLAMMVVHVRFFAGAARLLEGRSSGEHLRGHTSSVRREPLGQVAQVAPLNHPKMMAAWESAPALAAGKTVVLEPSDTTPASSVWMVERMQETFPPGVCNPACGDRETGAALTAHPGPRMVSITGSPRAGRAAAAAAAAATERSHVEPGSNAPVVVFDVDAAVEGISQPGLFNGGQDCTTATRLMAQDGVDDEPVAALTEAVAALAGRLAATSVTVGAGERWLVTGANGSGKSMLLSLLVGELQPTSGTVSSIGALNVGLLAQDVNLPDPRRRGPGRKTRQAHEDLAGAERAAVAPLSAHGLNAGRDEGRPVAVLSVGQQRRLALAVLLADPPDVLLLDEPANHLSLPFVTEIEEALDGYPGSVVVASHDRSLRRRWTGRRLHPRGPSPS